MKWRKKISNSTLMLGAVLILGFILRFYNTPRRYGFDYDATRDALIAIHGVQTLQLPLHGPLSALGTFHFGPWYYYQLILFQILLPFEYAPWISVSIISLFGIFCMYKLGETIGDWKLGTILALLAAVSPAQVIASTGLSNPDMVFASCSFVLWVFVKAVKEKVSLVWAFSFGLVLGIGINFHYQTVTFLLFPLLLLLVQKQQRIKFFTVALLGGLVSFIPLFVFNITHNWQTLKGFVFYLQEGKNAIYIPNSWTIYLRDFWPGFWASTLGVPISVGLIIGVLIGLIYLCLLYTKKIELSMMLIIIAFAIQFLYLRYYSGSRESYYLLYLHALIFTLVGYALWKVLKIKWGLLVGSTLIVVFLIFAIPKSFSAGHTTESYTIYNADILQLQKKYPNQSFSVYDCGEREKNNSQAYAFLLYHDDKLSDKGRPVVLYDETCEVNDSFISKNGEELSVSLDVDTHKKKIFVFNSDMNNLILKSGWESISPKSVYEREIFE